MIPQERVAMFRGAAGLIPGSVLPEVPNLGKVCSNGLCVALFLSIF